MDWSKFGLILIPGVPKSGTSSMFSELVQFEDVISNPTKEVNLPLDEETLSSVWYEKLNPEQKKTGWLLDASQNYCWDWKHNDLEFLSGIPFRETKVILMFRNPIFRSYSNYEMNRKQHGWSKTFQDGWKEYVHEKGQKIMGDYLKFYRKNARLFGEENVHVMIAENYFKNRVGELQRVAEFLGFDEDVTGFQQEIISPMNDKPQAYNMDDRLYAKLVKHFKGKIKRFEKTLSIETSWI